jgi:site-specific recombinase XerD
VPASLLKKATLYPHKHRSGNVTWVVNVGRRTDGRPDLRRFNTQEDAEFFQQEWNLKLVNEKGAGLADLQSVARHEVLAALGKLEAVGSTLGEAVDFFLKFGRPPRGKTTLQEAVTAFLYAKEKKKRSQKYQETMKATTLDPFGRALGFEKPVSSVTREQVQAFLHGKRDWSSRTVKTHHDYLRTFFRWCVKEGYTRLDPVEGFELPKLTRRDVAHWHLHEIWIQLEAAQVAGKYSELAAMVLASFCGVRVEETERVNWTQIDLARGQLTMSGDQVKTARRRFAEIPANASQWLKMIPEGERRGMIASRSTIHNGLRRLRVELENKGWLTRRIQNGFRQAFAAYHYAVHHDAQFLSEIMANSPVIIRGQYHELVPKADGELFFALFPRRTLVEGVALALKKDLFSKKSKLERFLKSHKELAFAYVDASRSAVAWEMEDLKAIDLKRYAWHLRDDTDKGALNHESLVEGLAEHKQVTIPPALASGFYEAHRILTDYGFSPLESDSILLLRQVRAALEGSFGLPLDRLDVTAPHTAPAVQ